MAKRQRTIHRVRATIETAAGEAEYQDRPAVLEASVGLALVVANAIVLLALAARPMQQHLWRHLGEDDVYDGRNGLERCRRRQEHQLIRVEQQCVTREQDVVDCIGQSQMCLRIGKTVWCQGRTEGPCA